MYIPLHRNSAVNDIPARNVVGSAAGPTLGQRGGSLTPYATTDSMNGSSTALGSDGAPTDTGSTLTDHTVMGKPFTWWGVLAALLFGVMFLARRYGPTDDFRNVRLTVYNVAVVSLMSVVGIAFFKVVANRFPVKGLTPLINAV